MEASRRVVVVVCKESDHAQFGGEEVGARGADARRARERTDPDRGDRTVATALGAQPTCSSVPPQWPMAQQVSMGRASGHRIGDGECIR